MSAGYDPARAGQLGAFTGLTVVDTDMLFRGEALLMPRSALLVAGTRPLTPHAAWVAELRSIVRDGALAAFPDLRLPPERFLPAAPPA